MTLESYLAFSAAAAALAFVPGPTVTVIIANSLRYGARAGLMNVAGTQAGFVIWLAIAALGLGAAIQVMGIWFDVLRYAGAAYLGWLAIKLFRSKGDLAVAVDRARPRGSFFLQGFIVIMSNPKMLVLFGAMIPPFIVDGSDPMQQILLLGVTFVAIAGVGDIAYALMAGKAGAFLSRSRIRALEIVSGCFLLGGGIWMALRGALMARTGFYPGSFDPVTYDHLDIIARSARLVDKLVLGVGVHHGKQALIAAETRISLLEKVTRPIAEHTGVKIMVATFDGLAVDAARKHHAGLIIRGLRDSTDFDYEVQMGQMNGAMAPDIETVFLAASPATRMIASSLVKQIARMGGDITLFIPREAQEALAAALKPSH